MAATAPAIIIIGGRDSSQVMLEDASWKHRTARLYPANDPRAARATSSLGGSDINYEKRVST
jgi:hypothetical protein